ncbi:MAG: radical SAM protein [Myxococcota bacterium]
MEQADPARQNAPQDPAVKPSTAEAHEAAAHQKRNWVRLTYACNDRCIFCLDSDSHDGEMRDVADVKRQILDGRRKGAERLILSGGEPTIHPHFVDFVRLGRLAGYEKVQTVTNGRMFRYRPFLSRCLDAGLSEITFSIHGPNAKIHDALVGVKGAFDEEVRGLENALSDGRPIVNIDVVVNRANVRYLADIIDKFVRMGVREYDLLQIIPFGRAFREGKDTLFYDLDEAKDALFRAFSYARLPDMHLWLNRFPPAHCEGFEDLIQDPYKLNDEVRGRRQEFDRLFDFGELLDCRQPARCRYCYLEPLCDTLEQTLNRLSDSDFEGLRVDVDWEVADHQAFGGDPASERRARRQSSEQEYRAAVGSFPPATALVSKDEVSITDAALFSNAGSALSTSSVSLGASDAQEGRRRLRVLSGQPSPVSYQTPEALAQSPSVTQLHVVAKDMMDARSAMRRFPSLANVSLELGSYEGLEDLLEGEVLDGKRLTRVLARHPEQAERLLALDASFEVVVLLLKATEAWLLAPERTATRLAIQQPTWERSTDSRAFDVELPEFFAKFRLDVPRFGIPRCIGGQAPTLESKFLDLSMLRPDGRPEIFRFTKRYIDSHYFTKPLRCTSCVENSSCRGLHISYVRTRGFGCVEPILESNLSE